MAPDVHLYVSPAASGKTEGCVQHIRDWLRASARIGGAWACVPNKWQARALRDRLARSGGTLGVRVETLDRLWREILAQANQHVPLLPDVVQHRVFRSLADELLRAGRFAHFAPIVAKPSLVAAMRSAIRELKRARVGAEELASYWSGAEPALGEPALLYEAYERWLGENGWADLETLGELAIAALEQEPTLAADVGLLLVDGFDQFDALQLETVGLLAPRVGRCCVTLTGELGVDGDERMAHRRFDRARIALQARLGVEAEAAPPGSNGIAGPLSHLERHIFRIKPPRTASAGAIEFVEATDQASEVREALRWLKARCVDDGLSPSEVALLARDLGPYRAVLREVADEFGLPLQLAQEDPLSENPAIAALMELLSLPWKGWPWREVVDAMRSPYFDWSCLGETSPADADLLAQVARWGQVIAGADQWQDALRRLAEAPPDEREDEEGAARPAELTPSEAKRLSALWSFFVDRISPPEQESMRNFAAWVEDLIGSDQPDSDRQEGADDQAESLRVLDCVMEGEAPLCQRDLAALSKLKEVLGGLVLAEETVGAATPVTYERFWHELNGAIVAAGYEASPEEDREAILAADVYHARGLSFDAVAIIGMAEGVMPPPRREDALLPDDVRLDLQSRFGAPGNGLESDEPTAFYEAVTRARRRLLLTRPRIADDGAPWEASPYWESVRELLDEPETQHTYAGRLPHFTDCASCAEALANMTDGDAWPSELDQARPLWEAARHGAQAWRARQTQAGGIYDGDLGQVAAEIAGAYGKRRTWSASRLESYARCPFSFFAGYVLQLEQRQPPEEGLDVSQLGTLYHRILERTYQEAGEGYTVDELLAALARVAQEELEQAPIRSGFRPTAWWPLHQEEIMRELGRAVERLEKENEGYVPRYFEQTFGLGGRPALTFEGPDRGDDEVRIGGVIDRVDVNSEGGLRIIDYKTFGNRSAIPAADVIEGRRLQLTLYALAARDALGLGQPKAGFYWHVRSAEASAARLDKMWLDGVLPATISYVRDYVAAIRGGRFAPEPPEDGCPAYCPASSFCWHCATKGW